MKIHNTNMAMCRAIPADANPIHTLVREAFSVYVPHMGREATPVLEDYHKVLREDYVWKVESPNGLAAAMVLRLKEGTMFLETLAVRPDDQGKGIGSVLLEQADREALKFGHTNIDLCTNEVMVDNVAMYSKRGYVETHRLHYLGTDVIYMSKQLDTALAA